MKFSAIVILPSSVDVHSADAFRHAVLALMRPFEVWDADDPVPPGHRGHWDGYFCCSKEWLMANDRASDVYSGQEDLVFPVDKIDASGIAHALVTPTGEWHESRATYTRDDPDWIGKALALCRAHAGHLGVLLHCHC